MKNVYSFAMAVGVSVLFFTGTTKAQVLLSESFKYSDGPLVGASGSPWTTTSGTPGQLNVVSGELFLSDDDSEDAAASFSSAVTGGILTASFNFRGDADEASTASGVYFAHFLTTGGGGTQIGRVFVADAPNADEFLIGIATTTGTPVFFASPFAVGVNLSLTLSYDFDTDLASLSIAGFGTVTATDAVDTASIDRFQWREGSASQGDAFVDDLVVVPEPSTWAMIVVGAGLLVATRLRRKTS